MLFVYDYYSQAVETRRAANEAASVALLKKQLASLGGECEQLRRLATQRAAREDQWRGRAHAALGDHASAMASIRCVVFISYAIMTEYFANLLIIILISQDARGAGAGAARRAAGGARREPAKAAPDRRPPRERCARAGGDIPWWRRRCNAIAAGCGRERGGRLGAARRSATAGHAARRWAARPGRRGTTSEGCAEPGCGGASRSTDDEGDDDDPRRARRSVGPSGSSYDDDGLHHERCGCTRTCTGTFNCTWCRNC